MEHLLAVWSGLKERLRAVRRIMLLCDYDGTLTPIVERPEMANLADSTRRTLRELSRRRRFTVGIISGRAIADLRDKVALDGIIYAGNHGMEIVGPGINLVTPLADEIRPILRVLHQVLDRTLGRFSGVLVENKGLSLSVHYRMVDEGRTGDVKREFERIVGGIRAIGKVRTTAGKKVLEVRPSGAWDKGKAVSMLMKRFGRGGWSSGLVPIYLGDDLTDEDGFRVVEKYGNGVSVLVGEPKHGSCARYFLNNPAEVEIFLETLLTAAEKDFR